MSIKASKDDLARLLAGDGLNSFVAHNDTKTLIPTAMEPKEERSSVIISAPKMDEGNQRGTPPQGARHDGFSAVSAPQAAGNQTQEEIEPLENPDVQPKVYRSQGLTIYESDDDLIDGFLTYMRKKKLRIGRKKGFSLFARAGLRALEDVRLKNPVAFEEILVRALQEQK